MCQNRLRPAVPTCYDRRRHPWEGALHVRHEAATIHHAGRWRSDGVAAHGTRAATGKVPRLGVLLFSNPQTDPQMEVLHSGLRDLGYDDQSHYIFYRYAEGKPERLADLAAALDHQNAPPAFARLDGAHQTGGAGANDDYIITAHQSR